MLSEESNGKVCLFIFGDCPSFTKTYIPLVISKDEFRTLAKEMLGNRLLKVHELTNKNNLPGVDVLSKNIYHKVELGTYADGEIDVSSFLKRVKNCGGVIPITRPVLKEENEVTVSPVEKYLSIDTSELVGFLEDIEVVKKESGFSVVGVFAHDDNLTKGKFMYRGLSRGKDKPIEIITWDYGV